MRYALREMRCRHWFFLVVLTSACASFTSTSDTTPDASVSDAPPPPPPPPPDGAALPDAAAPDGDAGGSYAELVLASSPLAYWRMNVKSGNVIPDITNHGYDLDIVGGAPGFGVAGAIADDPDTAIEFGGTVYAMLGTAKSRTLDFGALEPFTIELWAKRSASVTPNSYNHLFGNIEGAASNSFGYIFYYNKSDSQMWFEYDSQADSGLVSSTVKSTVSPTDRYAYYAVTFDGAILALYVDGIMTTPTPATRPMGTRGFNFVVAKEQSTNVHGFAGAIDEMAVYTKALPAVVVATHFERGIHK
jgi:hypothetical protein